MPLRDYLRNNLGLKLFSLFLAALIWLSARFYAGDEIQSAGKALRPVVTRQFLRQSIKAMQPAGAAQYFKVEPTATDVTVSGEVALLSKLSSKEIVVFVNLTNWQNHGGTNAEVEVFLPPGVVLVQVQPPTVRVERFSP